MDDLETLGGPFLVTHPVAGMLLIERYSDAHAACDAIGEAYDLNEIGTLKSRCHITHTTPYA